MNKLYKHLKFTQNEPKKAKAMTRFDPDSTVIDVELLSL